MDFTPLMNIRTYIACTEKLTKLFFNEESKLKTQVHMDSMVRIDKGLFLLHYEKR
jgi:hypothetical protein